jgi:hypothetical protein
MNTKVVGLKSLGKKYTSAAMMVGGLLAPFILSAQPAQLGFKDIFIGQGVEYFHGKKQYICTTDPKSTTAEEMCSLHPGEKPTIANAPATAVIAQIYSGQVHDILVYFKPVDFVDVSAAFIEKYGAAHAKSTEPLTTAAGAKFENQILEWKFETGTLRVQKYGSRITNSIVFFSSHDAIKLFQALKQKRASKGANDL